MDSKTPALRATLDEQRWHQVSQRRAEPASFVYAVRTTGIYCRPGCASRLPLRRNVQFFDHPADAIAAGFRACKRCKPVRTLPVDAHIAGIASACALMAQGVEPPALEVLAQHAGLSPDRFRKVFKRKLGVTPRQYGEALRRARLHARVPDAASVTQAVYEAGFNSVSSVYGNVGRLLGMKPASYRRGGTNESIYYAIGTSYLGAVLIAATRLGLCAIQLGDNPRSLVQALRKRFPAADVSASPLLTAALARVLQFIEQPADGLDLPLDVRGTAFQQRVWSAMQAIPAGKTCSYRELAAMIDAPTSARAVAQACGANKLAVVIPCHRVHASDGGLGGYRWGIDRKRALVDRESCAAD